MIQVKVPAGEVYDSRNEVFYYVEKDTTIQLEHSLISMQKWESKWHKPFLVEGKKTTDEAIDYIRCMCLTPNVKDDVFYCIPSSEQERISKYIDDPMTATWFRENKSPSVGGKKEVVTAEIIYYWMIKLNIPSEYKKWHLNQLLTLIRVINAKDAPKKKHTTKEILEEHRLINQANRKRFNTKG